MKRFREIFLNRYYERQEEFVTEEDKLSKYISKLEKDKKRLIRLGRDGVLDDDDLKEELMEVKGELMDSKIKLNETHGEEFKIEYLVDYAENIIRTMDKFWFDADSSVKIKFQRLMFPNGVFYNYPGFSNLKLSPVFEIIESIAAQKASTVTLPGFEPG